MKRLPEDSVDLVALRDTFVFANTPSYLFKRFKADSSVQNLALGFSDEELITGFERVLRGGVTDVDSLVKAYALVSGLALRDSAEAKKFFEELPTKQLPWAAELSALYSASVRQGTIYSQPAKYRIPAGFDASSETPTT
jgi:hypothetical protein